MAINAEAMLAERYDVAFYALSGALHAADEFDEASFYESVAQLAEEQSRHVDDTHTPSAVSAIGGRKAASAFRLLALQARAHAILSRRKAAR